LVKGKPCTVVGRAPRVGRISEKIKVYEEKLPQVHFLDP